MNLIDILIVAVFAVAVIRGLRKGIIGQLGSLAAIVAALIGSRALAPVLEPVTAPLVPESLRDTAMGEYIGAILAGALVYAVIYYIVRLLSAGLRRITHILMLGPLDRVAGAIFSVFKWGLGLSIALNLWLALFPESTFVKDSTVGGGVAVENVMEIAPWLWGIATSPEVRAL